MARIIPAPEVGLPEGAGRVRVSSSRARRGKILAVEHPVFGWVKYREWALLSYLERLVERTGPVELVAWVGLTLTYAQGIQTVSDFLDWTRDAVGSQLEGVFIPTGTFTQELPELPAEGLGRLFASVSGMVMKYFYAALAAAITIITLKSV